MDRQASSSASSSRLTSPASSSQARKGATGKRSKWDLLDEDEDGKSADELEREAIEARAKAAAKASRKRAKAAAAAMAAKEREEQATGENGKARASSSAASEEPPPRPRPPSPPPVPPREAHPGIAGCRSVYCYERLNHIEEGSYGVVFRARDKETGEIVALKKLKMDKETNGFPITSLREIRTLMEAAHENVVRVREIVVGDTLTQ